MPARGRAYVLVPPVQGLNTRDTFGEMKESYASVLDNLEPLAGALQVRPGYEQSIEPLADPNGVVDPDPASRLFSYTGGGQSQVIATYASGTFRAIAPPDALAFDGGLAFEDGDAGLAGAECAPFDNKLVMGNGLTTPCYWDGTAITALTIDGPTSSASLKGPLVFKSRFYWIERGTTKAWYGGVNLIQGTGDDAFHSFDIALVKPVGGTLCGLASISRDGGDGPADYIAFITTEGDILVYSGSDPGDATSFAIVGHYKAAQILLTGPISDVGIAVMARIAGDVIIGTVEGFISLAALMTYGRNDPAKIRLSDAITPDVQAAVSTYGVEGPWRLVNHPTLDWLIACFPTSPRVWYVYKLGLRAWFRVTGLPTGVAVAHETQLWFGLADGSLNIMGGGDDAGQPIRTDYLSAWTACRMPVTLKRFTSVRPFLTAPSGSMTYDVRAGVDFRPPGLPNPALSASSDGDAWDDAVWDVSPWGGAVAQITRRKPVVGQGYRIGVRIATLTQGVAGQLHHTEVIYEPGSV